MRARTYMRWAVPLVCANRFATTPWQDLGGDSRSQEARWSACRATNRQKSSRSAGKTAAFYTCNRSCEAACFGSRIDGSPWNPVAETSVVASALLSEETALRNEAFARALTDAKACASDPESLRALFDSAAKKASTISKKPFRQNWAYLQTMLRLIRAYHRGEYDQVSDDALVWIIAALSYLVDPFDLIPDNIPLLGLVDDAHVVELVTDKTRRTLDAFMAWETAAH